MEVDNLAIVDLLLNPRLSWALTFERCPFAALGTSGPFVVQASDKEHHSLIWCHGLLSDLRLLLRLHARSMALNEMVNIDASPTGATFWRL